MESLVTVTAASDSLRLAGLPAVRAALAGAEASDETLLRDLDSVSATIANHCRRTFARQTYRQTFRPTRETDALRLAHYPVVAITSVTSANVLLDPATDYETDTDPASPANAGLLYRLFGDRRRCWASYKVVVEYQAGWVLPDQSKIGDADAGEPDLPSDIEDSAASLVKLVWFGHGRDPAVRREDLPGVIMQQFWVGDLPGDPALPGDIRRKLEPYRNTSRS
jgi:hypothetical protein